MSSLELQAKEWINWAKSVTATMQNKQKPLHVTEILEELAALKTFRSTEIPTKLQINQKISHELQVKLKYSIIGALCRIGIHCSWFGTSST